MYHIKQDKRSLSTAETIKNGMYQCLETKPFHEITISDIHRITGISRATIYRLFDTTEDILVYMCDKYIEELQIFFNNMDFSKIEDIGFFGFRISFEKYELPALLVKNHRQDLLFKIYAEKLKYLDKENYPLSGLTDMEHQYIWPLLYSNMSTVFTTWIQNGRKETPEELYQIIMKYGELFHQFCNL